MRKKGNEQSLSEENERLSLELRHALTESNILKRKLVKLENAHNDALDGKRPLDFDGLGILSNNYYYYKLLIDKCPVSMCVFNEKMKYITGTSLFLSLLDCKNERRLKGCHFTDVFLGKVNSDWLTRTLYNCMKTMNSHHTLKYSEEISLVNANPIYAHITIIPLSDNFGDSLGVLMIMEDATKLNLLTECIENDSVEMSDFFFNINNSIAAPINAIKSLCGLLTLTSLDQNQADYLQAIQSEIQKLEKCLADLVKYTTGCDKKREVTYKTYDFASFINDIANAVNIRASHKNIDFITDISPDIPAALIGDDKNVKQVLFSIFDNALSRTKHGYIKLAVSCCAQKSERVQLSFSVADTGGIDFASQNEISSLEKKSKACVPNSKIITHNNADQGVVVTFCTTQQIASEHPIAHMAQSEERRVLLVGSGIRVAGCESMLRNLRVPYDCCVDASSFTVMLTEHRYTHLIYFYNQGHRMVMRNLGAIKNIQKIAVKDLRFLEKQPTPPDFNLIFEPITITDISGCLSSNILYSLEDLRSDSVFRTRNAKILVVDDSKVNLMIAKNILQNYNCIVETVDSGATAIERTLDTKYDLIFMDHMMEIMDGVETATAIRDKENQNSTTPIVALSANAVPGIVHFFTKNGMNDFLAKPILIDELNRILSTWLPREKLDFSNGHMLGIEMPSQILATLKGLGVDADIPIRALGGSEMSYLTILKTFVVGIPTKLDELLNLSRTQNSGFRISVHGMKGALSSIGATMLSDAARKLENAAIDGDFDLIANNLPAFCLSLQDFYDKLMAIIPDGSVETTVEMSLFELKKMLEDVQILILNLEADDASNLVQKILQSKHMPKIESQLKQLELTLGNYDYDSALNEIAAIFEVIKIGLMKDDSKKV